MSQIDWQAYLDGSLAPEERANAERVLSESEAARKEVDGLKTFLSSIREAAMAERVPMDRLEAMIPSEKKRGWDWRIAGPILAAAAAAFVVYLVLPHGPNVRDNGIDTSDSVLAANWIQPDMPFKVPAVSLDDRDRPLVRLHHTRGGCCFDFKVNGNIYHVNVLDLPMKSDGRPVRLSTGITAFTTRGVRWSQNNLVFFVVGPDIKTSIDVASAASTHLQRF